MGGFTTVVSMGASDFVFVVRTIFGVRGHKTRRRTVSMKKRPLTTPRRVPLGRFHVYLYRIRVARTQKLAIKSNVQIGIFESSQRRWSFSNVVSCTRGSHAKTNVGVSFRDMTAVHLNALSIPPRHAPCPHTPAPRPPPPPTRSPTENYFISLIL